MANLDFVTTRLATGGDLPYGDAAALRDLREWQRLGITHVIDNRIEWSDEDFVADHAPEITYLHNGVDDAGQQMPDAWFDRGVSFALEALAQPDTKVLVHCHMGINRGPSLAYAILLASGDDPIDAIDALRIARPIAGVGYAEDALDWHHRRTDAPDATRASDRRRLAGWRRGHWIDIVRIIRSIREFENEAS